MMFYLVENMQHSSFKKPFDLTKKRHIRKSDELISKSNGFQSTTSTTDKKKSMSLRSLYPKSRQIFS